MSKDPDNHQLAQQLAVLEGDMKAIRGENEAMEARIDASLARMQEENVRRDKTNIQWSIGLAIAMTTLIIGAIAIL